MPYRWRAASLAAAWLIATLVPLIGVPVLLPAMAKEFGTSGAYTAWVSLAYSLAMAGAFVPGSHVGDLLGHRRVALAASYVEAAFMLAIVFLPNVEAIIAVRFLQGFVHSLCVPNFQAFAVSAFPANERGRVLGFISFTIGAGTLVVPIGVGVVTDELGWRWVMGLGAALVLAITAAGQSLREAPAQRRKPAFAEFDVPGAVLLMVGVAPIIIGVQMARRASDVTAWVLVAAGLAVLVGLIAYEARARFPMLPMRLFKRAVVTVPQAHNMLFNFTHGVGVYLLPVFFIEGLEWTAKYAATVLIAYNVARPPAALVAGLLTDKIGATWVVAAAAILQAAALVGLVAFGDSGLVALVAFLVIWGLSGAMVGTANQQQAYASMPKDQFALAGGTLGLGRHLSQALGTGIAAGMFAALFTDGGRTQAAARDGFETVLATCAVVFVLGMAASWLAPTLWGVTRRRPAPADGTAVPPGATKGA